MLRLPAFPHPRLFLRAGLPPSISLSSSSASTTLSPLQSHLRTMSTAPKKEFLCILPDKPGAQAKRLEVRP
jgi:hypothetical protein